MLAAVDWDNLVPAAAFVLGAIVATVATLRVVRAVAVMFGRRDRHDDDDARSK